MGRRPVPCSLHPELPKVNGECPVCGRERRLTYMRAYRAAHPQEAQEANLRYVQKRDKTKHAEAMRRYREKCRAEGRPYDKRKAEAHERHKAQAREASRRRREKERQEQHVILAGKWVLCTCGKPLVGVANASEAHRQGKPLFCSTPCRKTAVDALAATIASLIARGVL